jgi:type IV secretory pathway TrbD component
MHSTISAALVTNPALMALVLIAGLAMAVGLAVWTVDQARILMSRKDDP